MITVGGGMGEKMGGGGGHFSVIYFESPLIRCQKKFRVYTSNFRCRMITVGGGMGEKMGAGRGAGGHFPVR